MAQKNPYRYVAYDAANGEYEEFDTIKNATDWLTENDGEGISEEACNGQNFIAEIQYRSCVTQTDCKENYHQHTDQCPEDCDEEVWPHSDDFDWVGVHRYEKVDYEETPVVDVQIEGKPGDYSAYIASDNCPFGCIGEGTTIGETIDCFLESVEAMRHVYKESKQEFPKIKFVYHHS